MSVIPEQEEIDDIPTFAKRIRDKFDAYHDIDDAELTERIVRKHPTYASKVKLPEGFKLLQTTSGYKELDDLYENAGRENNVDPNLLLEQARQETSFDPDVMYGRKASSKGARGSGQFIPGTAKRFGVNVKDPKSGIIGQAKYMRELLDMFDGDETLALAGYNAGEGAVKKYGNKIPPYRETHKYTKNIGQALEKVRSGESTLRSFIDDKPIVTPTPTVPGQKPLIAPGQPLAPDPNDEPIQAPSIQPADDGIDRSIYKGNLRYLPNTSELEKIGEAAKEGKEYEDNYEVQTRFNLEQIKNPNLTVEEFNKNLQAEYDAERAIKERDFLEKNKDYAEWLKAAEKKDSNESRQEFNEVMKAAQPVAQQQVAEFAGRTKTAPQTVPQRKQVNLSLGLQPTSGGPTTPSQGRYATEKYVTDLQKGATKWDVTRSLAGQIANKYNVDFDIAQKVIESEAFTGLPENIDINEYLKAQQEAGRSHETEVGGSVIRKIVEADKDYKARKVKADELAAQKIAQIKDTDIADRDAAEFEARMQAQVETGLMKPGDAQKAIEKTKADVRAWKEDKGFLGLGNEEQWAKFWSMLDGEEGQTRYTESRGDLPAKSAPRKSYKEYYDQAYRDTIAQYGTVSAAIDERRRFRERFKDAPYTYIAKQLETFAGGVGKVPFKTVGAILESVAIGSEAVERLTGGDLGDPDDPDARKKVTYKLGQDLKALAEAVPIDKDFRGGAMEIGGDVLGQVVTQALTGVATKSAAIPALLGAAMGGSAQYEEAAKNPNSTPGQRIGAFIAAGLLSVPDYFIFRSIIKGKGLLEATPFLNRFTNSVKEGLIKKGWIEPAAQKVATSVTDGFLKEMAEKGGWRGMVGRSLPVSKRAVVLGAGEGGQEVSETKGNDLFAYLTYDPTPERWNKLVGINKENIIEGVAGFFGGLIGAGIGEIQVRASNLSEEAREQAQDLLEQYKDDLPEQTYDAALAGLDAAVERVKQGVRDQFAPVVSDTKVDLKPGKNRPADLPESVEWTERDDYIQSVIDSTPKKDLRGTGLNEVVNKAGAEWDAQNQPQTPATDADTQETKAPSPEKGAKVTLKSDKDTLKPESNLTSPIRSRTRELGLIRPKEVKEIAPSKLESSASSDVSGITPPNPASRDLTPEEVQERVDSVKITKKGNAYTTDLWPGRTFASAEEAQSAVRNWADARRVVEDWRAYVDQSKDQTGIEQAQMLRQRAERGTDGEEILQLAEKLPWNSETAHVYWQVAQSPKYPDALRKKARAMYDEHWDKWNSEKPQTPARDTRKTQETKDEISPTRSPALEARKQRAADRKAEREKIAPSKVESSVRGEVSGDIVQRAIKSPITDVGQLSAAEKRALNKAVKDGVLIKQKNASYPNPKPMWMAKLFTGSFHSAVQGKGGAFFTPENAARYVRQRIAEPRADVQNALIQTFGLSPNEAKNIYDAAFPTRLSKIKAYRRVLENDPDFREDGVITSDLERAGDNIDIDPGDRERIEERARARFVDDTDFQKNKREAEQKKKEMKRREREGQGTMFTGAEALRKVPETPTVEKDATTQEPLRAVPEDVKPKLLDFYQQAFTLPSIEGKNAEQRTILKHLKQKGNALQALVKCIHK